VSPGFHRPDPTPSGAGPARAGEPPPLAAAGVTQRFGRLVALEDVSLELPAGCVTCLLGDNGAGKSTLIRILSGVHLPTAGTVRVDGRAVRLRSPRDARRCGIATVYQDLALAPLLSVWRNFVLGAEPTLGSGPFRRLDVEGARARAGRELADMGIDLADVSQPVGRLSGGQRQAIAIARAVHLGARVLILDEPAAALGMRQAAYVLDTITRSARRGAAVLLVTHNPLHAWPVGDAFIILRHGRVAGRWEKDEVTAEMLSRLMVGAQA